MRATVPVLNQIESHCATWITKTKKLTSRGVAVVKGDLLSMQSETVALMCGTTKRGRTSLVKLTVSFMPEKEPRASLKKERWMEPEKATVREGFCRNFGEAAGITSIAERDTRKKFSSKKTKVVFRYDRKKAKNIIAYPQRKLTMAPP